jgi:hypothetical protein
MLAFEDHIAHKQRNYINPNVASTNERLQAPQAAACLLSDRHEHLQGLSGFLPGGV